MMKCSAANKTLLPISVRHRVTYRRSRLVSRRCVAVSPSVELLFCTEESTGPQHQSMNDLKAVI